MVAPDLTAVHVMAISIFSQFQYFIPCEILWMTSIKAKLLEPEKEYGLWVQVGGVLIGNHSKSEKSPIATRN